MIMRIEETAPARQELGLLPVELIQETAKAIDDASDEVRRLNLEVCNPI
jgi:hypothetical protein